MNIFRSIARIPTSVREHGVSGTVRKIGRNLQQSWTVDNFDAIHGTNTKQREWLSGLSISSENLKFGVQYEPTGERELKRVFALLNVPTELFTFIDLGCGKGRTLLIAGALGFKKVVGVEFARELAIIAEANLEITKTKSAEIVQCDAADHVFPKGNILVYMYHPFGESVLQRVVDNLSRAAAERPQASIYVVYKNPQHKSELISAPYLKGELRRAEMDVDAGHHDLARRRPCERLSRLELLFRGFCCAPFV